MDKCIIDEQANLMPPPHIRGRVVLPAIVGVEQGLANLPRLYDLLSKSLEVDAPCVLKRFVRGANVCMSYLSTMKRFVCRPSTGSSVSSTTDHVNPPRCTSTGQL